ncbi:MAG: glycosyltransferase family 61 protein [Spirosoma sp.]|uniref:glycosyltransferase family 61 protein n=1 Tax=unclassified Spirosoma TaxID=2621999 RepID=UPI00095DCE7A|nr:MULTISPECIES: glycosyltransferase family 61 protein [unclassified Spirosoma]MBN8826889.1 glycosyltransferase family 61 protein [Spirosoma sp.]OJW72936.1 MAG: hypothetical protein BGO59_09365 [Spirosoma sp. 48-14]
MLFLIHPIQTLVRRLIYRGKKLSKPLLKWMGFDVLNRADTENFLQPFQVYTVPANPLSLPAIVDFGKPEQNVFKETEASVVESKIWKLTNTERRATQLSNGSILIDTKILETDYRGSQRLVHSILSRSKRLPVSANTLIAPWSHYMDGIQFRGYYDFVLGIASKICRLKQGLSPLQFQETVVAYPLLHTTYEHEFLGLLGFHPQRILDSRVYDVNFQNCLIGSSGHWYYPNRADIVLLKSHLEQVLLPKVETRDRLYIRRSGRRRVRNEPELLAMLKKYEFTIIDDKPRTIRQQVSLYKNASVIIGPHGASFTNCIFCEPGTHLIELFSPAYRPDYFRYIAHIMGLTYSAYCYGRLTANPMSQMDADILVSVDELERGLVSLFTTNRLSQDVSSGRWRHG